MNDEFQIANEWDMMREPNPAKKPSFDAIVANPPFSYRPTDALADDVRFKSHGLAPKSAADFAFLLHGFRFPKDEGVMAIIGGNLQKMKKTYHYASASPSRPAIRLT